MKAIVKNLTPMLLTVGATVLLANTAQAQLTMPEREHVQTIVWIVEAATFVTTISIVLCVWRISKRDRKIKDRSREIDKDE